MRPMFALGLAVLSTALGCGGASSESRSQGWVESHTGMEFVLVPAGSFEMGSPAAEPGREEQERLHSVTLSSPFFLGRYEVTQEQWSAVMGDNPSRYLECGGDCPVETVNRVRIEEFLERLSSSSGERLRLPTEAEWEYACRAGNQTAFGIGDAISSASANFDGRTPHPGAPSGPFVASTTPVGMYAPNAWGLYDMNGNVWEWCADEHCPYSEDPAVDPVNECGAELVVIRGGSWYYGADSARCGLRYTHRTVDDGPSLGFRVVREIPQEGR